MTPSEAEIYFNDNINSEFNLDIFKLLAKEHPFSMDNVVIITKPISIELVRYFETYPGFQKKFQPEGDTTSLAKSYRIPEIFLSKREEEILELPELYYNNRINSDKFDISQFMKVFTWESFRFEKLVKRDEKYLSITEIYYNAFVNTTLSVKIFEFFYKFDSTLRINRLVENTQKCQELYNFIVKNGVDGKIFETFRRKGVMINSDNMDYYRGIMINNMKNGEFSMTTEPLTGYFEKISENIIKIMKEIGYIEYLKTKIDTLSISRFLVGIFIDKKQINLLKEVF